MSFGWAVVTQPKPCEPWKNERFHGYFTDIRRAARKSLPRKPDKELHSLLGLSLVPAGLESHRKHSRSSLPTLNWDPASAGASRGPVILTGDRDADINISDQDSKKSGESSADGSSRCSFREKTMCAVAVYLAFLLGLLLVIVLVLVVTLNVTRSKDDESDALPILTTSRPPQTESPQTTINPITSVGSTSPAPSSTTGSTGTQTTATSATQPVTPNRTNETSTTPTPVTPNVTNATDTVDNSTTPTPLTSSATSSEGQTSTEATTTQPCLTEACLAANSALIRMNTSASPCVDFYQFACGKWEHTIHNSSRDSITNRQDELSIMLLEEIQGLLDEPRAPTDSLGSRVSSRLYKACLETNDVTDNQKDADEDLQQALGVFGLVPGGVFTRDLSEMWRLAHRTFNVHVLYDTTVEPVSAGGYRRYGVRLDPPRWHVRPSSYQVPLTDDVTGLSYINATTRLLHGYLDTLSAPDSSSSTDNSSNKTQQTVETSFDWLLQKVQTVYDLEANISTMVADSEGDAFVSETVVTRGQLRDLYPNLDSIGVFSSIPENVTVVLQPEYFDAIESLFEDPQIEDLKWFVFIRVILERVLPALPWDFREMFPSTVILHNVSAINCVENSLQVVSEDIHVLYVSMNTQKVLNNRIQFLDMKNKLVAAFRELLPSTTWIQSDMSLALDVLLKSMEIQFTPMVSHVQHWNITNIANRTFLSLSLELTRLDQDRLYTTLGSNVTDQMDMLWTETRPRYNRQFNRINMATGSTVYFTYPGLAAHMYGYLGNLMSREILKILLVQDASSSPNAWWGTESESAFQSVEQCFWNQSSKLQQSPTVLQTAILANGALQLATKVFETATSLDQSNTISGTSLTEEMLFFISSAQIYCALDDGSQEFLLNKERVNSMITNNADLENVFNCTIDTPMRTSESCSLLGP